ncbi:hypothetical protein [Nocardia amikacinitolerans]|nr:hypothetical protein [Nocardia amikacinitolerans]
MTGTQPDINEAEDIRWISLEEAVQMIERGEILGAATVIAVYRALSLPA